MAGTTTSARDAIHQLDAAFMRAANARDPKTLVGAFYAPDAVLLPPGHPAVEGAENIRAFLQGLMDSGFVSIDLETTAVETSGELACGRGHYTLRMAPPGSATVEEVGKYIVVYRLGSDGRWRATADIFNSDAAPMEQRAAA